jgi:hypothetical protein
MTNATPPDRDRYRTSVPTTLHVYPLTYDELDQDDSNPLTRLGGGPHITPEGFRANGYDSRYTLTLSSPVGAPASLRASVRLDGQPRSSRDLLVGLVPASGDQPKLELAAVADSALSSQAQLALRTYTSSLQTQRLNRSTWRFEFRFPELLNSGIVSPQGLTFLDDGQLLLTCHQAETLTAVYRVDVETGEYTGRALSTEYLHINSICTRSNGDVWGSTQLASLGGQNRAVRFDLEASFASGELTSAEVWDNSQIASGLAFLTVGGTEYVLCQQYATSGTVYCYVFLASQLSATVGTGDRVKRFDLGLTIQDLTVGPDGLVYVSRNAAQGSGSSYGWVQVYDLATAIASASDGAALTPLATYPQATKMAEGLVFHPDDGRLWALTEGHLAVGDSWGHCAVWSCAMPQAPEWNDILADWLSTGLLELRLNGRLMHSLTGIFPSVTATRLAIGGPPPASPGLSAGFMTAGLLRGVALKDGLLGLDELAALDAGDYEPNELTEQTITLVNPGGESGTTGWTDELSPGVLANRVNPPLPYAGSAYFMGAGSSNSRTRQRITFTPSAGSWARIEWQQASWDAATDPGGCGLRALDTNQAQLVYSPSGEAMVSPQQTWMPRAHTLALPSGTAYLDAIQHRTRTAGVNVDCYVDEIVLKVYSP